MALSLTQWLPSEIVANLNQFSALWASAMWRACWQGTLLIAAIWTVCRLAPKLPASVRYWLWWFACLKLLIGLLWISPVTLSWLPTVDTLANYAGALGMPGFAAQPDFSAPVGAPGAYATVMTDIAPQGLTAASYLMLLWSACLLVWGVIVVRQFMALRALVKQAHAVGQEHVAEPGAFLQNRLRLKYVVPVLASPDVPGPMVIGPARPVVVVPSNISLQLTAPELEMALAHEFIHVMRGDLWWAQIPALVQMLFFFHPLAWLARREWSINCEAACDEATVRLAAASPKEYGNVLLKLITIGRTPKSSAALSASSDYRMMSRRIDGLKGRGPRSRMQALGGLALLAAVAGVSIVPCQVTARPSHLLAAGEIYCPPTDKPVKAQPNITTSAPQPMPAASVPTTTTPTTIMPATSPADDLRPVSQPVALSKVPIPSLKPNRSVASKAQPPASPVIPVSAISKTGISGTATTVASSVAAPAAPRHSSSYRRMHSSAPQPRTLAPAPLPAPDAYRDGGYTDTPAPPAASVGEAPTLSDKPADAAPDPTPAPREAYKYAAEPAPPAPTYGRPDTAYGRPAAAATRAYGTKPSTYSSTTYSYGRPKPAEPTAPATEQPTHSYAPAG